MPRVLPARPNLEHLKNEAKDLVAAGKAAKLADAQRDLARDYGFPSWTKLKRHVDTLSSDPAKRLVALVRANDVAGVKALLQSHAELREVLDAQLDGLHFGGTILGPAVHNQSREMVDALLDAGADINVRSHWWAGGFSLLETADPAFAPFLLDRGAILSINAAARLDRIDDLQRMLREQPELARSREGDGQTALHVAASPEIASVLLDAGADIDALDVDHESTPAQYAIKDRQDVARFLLSRGARTDILMATALGDVERVRAILDADPGAIRTTISNEFFPMSDRRAGGTIYYWTLGGFKTAHIVARDFHHEHVASLLAEWTPPDFALAVAASGNDAVTIRRLLDGGESVNTRGVIGATPLHWAIYHRNVELFHELLRRNPDLEVRDRRYGGTPLDWAMHDAGEARPPQKEILESMIAKLLDAGAPLPEPRH